MNVQEALAKVLKELKELGPEELRAELDKHRTGGFAVALTETRDFLEEYMGQPQDMKDTYDALADADKMNENMRLYGTIDAPKEAMPFDQVGLEVSSEEYAKRDAELATLGEELRIQNLRDEAVKDGRKLVTVREIGEINDIPGADLIKVATVEGWKVVVKAGEFKEGDLCVFFEVDSYLPMSDPRYSFLEKNAIKWQDIPGARLKTIRLRKQLSQGLALPLSLFPEIQAQLKNDFGLVTSLNIGEVRQMNFTGTLGIFKWEKVMSAQLAGQAKGDFPSFLRKSDQERCQNMGAAIFGYEQTFRPLPEDLLAGLTDEVRAEAIEAGRMKEVDGVLCFVKEPTASRDTRYEVSLKMDGSSMTPYRKGEFGADDYVEGVCSRNLDLKMEGNEDNSFVQMAQSGLLDILREAAADTALQGELMGPGIQGNRENFSSNRFFVYNVYDIKDGEFLKPAERQGFINEMNAIAKQEEIDFVVEHVPVLHNNVTLAELGIHNMDDLLAFAVGPSLNNNVREGVVFKAMDGSHQFKAISNVYLEQEK
jgi:hypothetical protein